MAEAGQPKDTWCCSWRCVSDGAAFSRSGDAASEDAMNLDSLCGRSLVYLIVEVFTDLGGSAL